MRYNNIEVIFMQTIIYGVLQEEKKRNLEMQEVCRREISTLPKGTIIVKNVCGNKYYYLKYRQAAKIKTDYLGKNKEQIEAVKREIERRNEYKKTLKRLRVEYKQISKIVKD